MEYSERLEDGTTRMSPGEQFDERVEAAARRRRWKCGHCLTVRSNGDRVGAHFAHFVCSAY